MAIKYKFDYYYGSEADQFSFFRLPKVLIRDKRFKNISSDAKILYGILLDRMSLSIKNRWLDDSNRVYIIFTIAEIMEEFDCSERKAIELMAELDQKSGIGLIEKKRQGLGRPNLIYVKNFVAAEETDSESEKNESVEMEGEVLQFQNCRNVQVKNCRNVQVKNCENVQDQNCRNVQVKNCGNMQDQNCENVQIQNCTNGQVNYTNNNYTDNNDTDYSETESIYPINQIDTDEMDVTALYRKIVMNNISYEHLCTILSAGKKAMLNEIVELMVEVMAVNRRSLRIAGAEYPYQLVKNRFMCINQYHVEYVLDCMDQTSSKIGNIKSYMLTSLFNATATMDTYYTAAVHHDMVDGI